MKTNKKILLLLFMLLIVLIPIKVFLLDNIIGKDVQYKISKEASTRIDPDNGDTVKLKIDDSRNNQNTGSQLHDNDFFSLYYQPRQNLKVGINFNLELMQIAAAHSADFKHKGYVGNDSKINDSVRKYFNKYPEKDYEKDIFIQSMDGIVNKLYHGETDYILCYDKKLDKMIFNSDRPDLFANSGQIKNKNLLISVIKDFRSYTKADAFFDANKTEYEKIMNNFRTQFGFDFIGQIQELTGLNVENSEFKLVLSPSMEGGMAISLKDRSGKDVFINITNPSDTKENTLNTLYHEEIHNFIVPVLMKKWSDYDNKRFKGVLNQNTGDNGNAFNETLTRALTNIMIEKYHPEIKTSNLMALYLRTGWTNTDKIYDLLRKEYINNRTRYKTIEDFMPRILEYLDNMKNDVSRVGESFIFDKSKQFYLNTNIAICA